MSADQKIRNVDAIVPTTSGFVRGNVRLNHHQFPGHPVRYTAAQEFALASAAFAGACIRSRFGKYWPQGEALDANASESCLF